MDFSHGRSGRPSILAIVYTDGAAACRLMSDLGRRLRDAGVVVAGLVPYQAVVDDGGPRCDMEVEELSSHFILQLAEERDKQPHGCRVDPEAVQEAAALIAASFRNAPELLIVNKFGKLEADGGGLSDVISDAVDQGFRSSSAFRAASGAVALLHQWPRRRSDAGLAPYSAMAGPPRLRPATRHRRPAARAQLGGVRQ